VHDCIKHANIRKNEGTYLSRFVASVDIFVESSEKENVLTALSKLNDLKEVYEMAGECDIVSIASASCIDEFRNLLQKISKIKGVKSTISTIILQLHKSAQNTPKGSLHSIKLKD
jgi:DNA-binding Lrp family transcriptional regulator